jgi:hypothetical protein
MEQPTAFFSARIGESLGSFLGNQSWAWPADWAWGLPLIVITVLIHALGSYS